MELESDKVNKLIKKGIREGIEKARSAGVVCGDAMDIRITTYSNEVEIRRAVYCHDCRKHSVTVSGYCDKCGSANVQTLED